MTALIDLFEVLDTKLEDRDPYMSDDLAAFPYVNGGLFSQGIVIPRVNSEIIDIILNQASANFDWSQISPTIFGSVFESTLNPETRREGGMHYTSIENIHKVIDPLFLDELSLEFEVISNMKQRNVRNKRLKEFQLKLSSLKFLDPACGSGNFLTETYISLRRLENKIIKRRFEGQVVFSVDYVEGLNPIKISISQFYGIEINDFAVTVANTALWIAESQMLKETERIIETNLEFFPIGSSATIIEGNALVMNWEDVVPKDELSYIMGNPPFIGYTLQSSSQKRDLRLVEQRLGGTVDYVTGWYYNAAHYMQGSKIKSAFFPLIQSYKGNKLKRPGKC